MTGLRSALYTGKVVHRRLNPSGRPFTYRVFSVLLDLDELEAVNRSFRLFSVNGANLFSFRETDHGAPRPGGLKAVIERLVGEAGIDIAGGAVRLLCYPRMLGTLFNPLSVYFCDDRSGHLAALVYEVKNTFGERHRYVFPVGGGERAPLRHACAKEMYVSPFIGMEAAYNFAIVPPGERLAVSIHETDSNGPVLNASFTASRQELSDGTFARFALSYFAMGLKIIGGIHWEAFKLWRKGVPVHRHRAAVGERPAKVDQGGQHPHLRAYVQRLR